MEPNTINENDEIPLEEEDEIDPPKITQKKINNNQ